MLEYNLLIYDALCNHYLKLNKECNEIKMGEGRLEQLQFQFLSFPPKSSKKKIDPYVNCSDWVDVMSRQEQRSPHTEEQRGYTSKFNNIISKAILTSVQKC